MHRVCHVDFETHSSADIRKCGLDNYVNSPDFVVTVIAWAIDDGPVKSVTWPHTDRLPPAIIQHIQDGGQVHAWNSSFEYAVLTQHYGLKVGPGNVYCTMQKALAYGLPAGLLAAGRALDLDTIKDETKRLLMLQMGRPRKEGLPWHEVDRQKLDDLAAYCRDDVAAERAIDKVVPDLDPFERRLSLLDGEINRKGVLLDVKAIADLKRAANAELCRINAECSMLTGGEVTAPGSQTAKLLTWLQGRGYTLPDISKASVQEALTDPRRIYEPHVRRVLELRQQAAKSSVAKLDRMLDVAGADGRARNLLQFYGAGRTGRWAGRLVQPQNLPRVPDGHNAETVIGMAELGFDVDMDKISKSLRSCFIAKPGHVLVSADLSQIEARVLAWLADQADVVQAFANGEDVYTLTAKKVGSSNRQLGKVLVLACGYGMGASKFQATAAGYGVDLTEKEAEGYVYAWRDSNRSIVEYWRRVDNAVRQSLRVRGSIVMLPHGMAVRSDARVTQIKKPTGVKLTYHGMRFSDGGLVFDGVNGVSKKWSVERTYGGRLTENIVQSVARDVMAEGMLAHPEGIVMSVHDEAVWEFPSMDGKLPTIGTPKWAVGLPVASKTTSGRRYAK